MKNLKVKALCLGIMSTVLISSTAFAATTHETNNINLIAGQASTSAAKTFIASPNYVQGDGSTASTIIAEGGLIQEGSTGQAVVDVQTKLCRAGYNVSIDGIFGNGTMQAVKNFQRGIDNFYGRNALTIDGIVGSSTWYYLKSF